MMNGIMLVNNSKRVIFPKPLNFYVQKKFLNPDLSGLEICKILAVEPYADNVPTFTILTDSGHSFAYIPPHAFGKKEKELTDCVDLNCPDEEVQSCVLELNLNYGYGILSNKDNIKKEVSWDGYYLTLDWAKSNTMIHLVGLENGGLAFLRQSRFQIGGDKWNPPNWKKSRVEWKI